jgi:hypothetical protein
MAAWETKLVSSAFIESRWDELRELLTAAFSDTALSDGFTVERPAQHTREEIHKPGGSKLGHVVAVGPDGEVLGAALCLPTDRPEGAVSCDLGWFFTSPHLGGLERARIGNAIAVRAHEELAKSGYEMVVTEMGTEGGADYLSRKHGYVPAPFGSRQNRWIKCLLPPTESVVSDNSEKRQWQSAGEQCARYATVDIAKDDVVIDLKRVMRRARRPSATTLQLAEGHHYESSAGLLGMNHHCSANGYICFEDLTYRVLRDVPAGEELTFNYCTTEFELANPFHCLCGSPDCLGWVGGFKYLKPGDVAKIAALLSPFLASKLRGS